MSTARDVDARGVCGARRRSRLVGDSVGATCPRHVRLQGALDEHLDELAALLTSEHGKVWTTRAGSVTRGIEVVEFACGIPQLSRAKYTEQVARGVDSWSLRQPLGVCAGVGPFNFPAMIPLWMAPVAIAAATPSS